MLGTIIPLEPRARRLDPQHRAGAGAGRRLHRRRRKAAWTSPARSALFRPVPLRFGLGFSWALFVPMLIVYLVTSLEAIGDVTATSKCPSGRCGCSASGRRVLVSGANSLLAGVFNTFPSSVFAQNDGVIN